MYQELSASLKDKHNLQQWRADVVAWERDPFNRDDPYVTTSQGVCGNMLVERRVN